MNAQNIRVFSIQITLWKPIDEGSKLFTYGVYKTLLRIPQIGDMFQSTKHQRFLSHLIAHEDSRLSCKVSGAFMGQLMYKYFQHSCNPNLSQIGRDGNIVWFSIKPMKKGEEFYISLVSLNMDSIQKIQKQLWDLEHIKCKCPRCRGKISSPEQCRRMVDDPISRNIALNLHLMQMNIEQSNPTMLMDNCVAFLRKYGRMDWCSGIGNVIKIFQHLYKIRFTGDFNHKLTRDV